jgi:hypothetical protein
LSISFLLFVMKFTNFARHILSVLGTYLMEPLNSF